LIYNNCDEVVFAATAFFAKSADGKERLLFFAKNNKHSKAFLLKNAKNNFKGINSSVLPE
jgi:hypothetical protein